MLLAIDLSHHVFLNILLSHGLPNALFSGGYYSLISMQWEKFNSGWSQTIQIPLTSMTIRLP
jgi:hypothetical protein